MLFLYLFGMSKAFWRFSTKKSSCASFPQWHVPTPSSGLQHLSVMYAVLQHHIPQKLSHLLWSCWHSLPFFALCLVFQDLRRNVDDSSGRVPLGTAFLPPLPTPGFVFF